jgi:hypothetical protein
VRFDSWKAIASYLGKDESTVRRWERDLGLPVRRVQGAPGRSVFAYKEELDAWMTARQDPPAAPEIGGDARAAVPEVSPRRRFHVLPLVAATVLVVGVGWVFRGRVIPPVAAAAIDGATLVAKDGGGLERWRLPLASGERAEGLFGRSNPIEMTPGGGVLAGVGLWMRTSDERLRGGSVFEVSSAGAMLRHFSFDDTLHFGAGTYGPPWIISDYRVSPSGGARRIAVVAHHAQWWPSVLTILDERDGVWRRDATFVNAGWIEHLYWLSSDRLLVSGYNEALDGGVVALFDANAIGGELRASGADPKFDCLTCAPATPIRYFVLPRTEVNIATGSRFNRASVDVQDGGFVVRTVEVEQDGAVPAADALYDFSTDLTLRGVSFSGRYWEMHSALRGAGKIDHDAEHCPFRNGPRVIYRWDGTWTTVPLR